MKEDIKKALTLMCVSTGAQLAYERDPDNTLLKETWEKTKEALAVFAKKMSEKYKDEKPDAALIKWAEEEAKKCKAIEELTESMTRRAERGIILERPRTRPGR